MSFEYGFYNAVDHDRLYDAIQMGKMFDGLINDGVFATIDDYFQVKASEGMQVYVRPGRAWFNHTWNRLDVDYFLTLDPAEVILKRIDAVVLEVDESVGVRENSLKVVKGTPASSPVKPTLIKTNEVHQYPLAYISVGADVSAITQDVIQNAVGTSECPFVTGIIETIDTDELIQQWDAQYTVWKQTHTEDFEEWSVESRNDFNEWFANLQYVLDGDVAGHLQNEIDGIVNGTFVVGSTVYFPFIETIYVNGSTVHFPSGV